ncbi:MAG: hypothetical protein JSS40_15280 [Proteobacteria bacterium]|nr:hypothetical protein [Pseudomonadota bacterium]
MDALRHDALDGASQRVRMLSRYIESSVARLRDTRGRRGGSDGLVFMGVWHDSIPRILIDDPVLDPVDKLTWQVILVHAAAEGGAAFPTYDDFQKRNIGARATIARALAILRLTRWISLCSRVRDARSRFRGNVYAIHEEPATVADAILLDGDYMQFLTESRQHGHPRVRAIADAIHATLADQIAAGEDVSVAPDLAQRTLERIAAHRSHRRGLVLDQMPWRSKTERQPVETSAAPAQEVSKTELQTPAAAVSGPGSKTERGENQAAQPPIDRVQKLNADAEILKNHELDEAVQKLNSENASCSSSSFIKTTTTNTRAHAHARESSETELSPLAADLRWPPQLSSNELELVRMYLPRAPLDRQQELLFELQGRLHAATGGNHRPIPNRIGYLHGMIDRCLDGTFVFSSYGLNARQYWDTQDRLRQAEVAQDARLRRASEVATTTATTSSDSPAPEPRDPVARKLEQARQHWTRRQQGKST